MPQDGAFRVDDPKSARAAAPWIAVAPRALAGELEPLAKHRVQHGLASAAVVTVESIEESYKSTSRQEALKAFSLDIKNRGGGRFLLLAGDAEAIPPRVERPGTGSPLCATDAWYVRDDDDLVPDRAIGRIPAPDAESLRRAVARTIEYENDTKAAGWRRRVSFLAGSGGFGAAIDGALDATVSTFLDRDLPLEFELRVLRPDEKSPFGPAPGNEKTTILDFWNSGSLITIYAGHGSRHGIHTATGLGITRPIAMTPDLSHVEVRNGSPFVIIFACDTGQFFNPSRRQNGAEVQPPGACFAGAFLLQPRGAVAVYAASENSHPYPDLLMAHEMNELFKSGADLTVGELVTEAKRRMARGEGEFRKQVDRISGLFLLPEKEQARLRDFELSIYNLFGDPAVKLRRPEVTATLTSPGPARPGEPLNIKVTAPVPDGCDVFVSLEHSRAAAPRRQGYPVANDRVVDRSAGTMQNGQFTVQFDLPRTAPKRMVVVADIRGNGLQAAGALAVDVTAPEKNTEPPAGPRGDK